MEFQMITLEEESEELILDGQGLVGSEIEKSKMNYDWLLKLNDDLLNYQQDLSRLEDAPDFERQLEVWLINLKEFQEDKNDDQVLALVNQNLTIIYDIKWHLSEGDGSKSLSLAHMALTSSVKATSRWLNAGNHKNAEFCHEIALRFAKFLEDSDEFFLEDISTQEKVQLRQEHLIFLLNFVEILQARGDSNQAKLYLELVTAKIEPPVTPEYLASLTYNFAVDAYEAGEFFQASEWLEEALHFCGTENCSLKLKVYKLYGQVLIQIDAKTYWKNAVEAYEMAFSVKKESGILVSLTKCVLISGKTILVKMFLEESLIPKKDFLEPKDAETIISMLMEKNHSALACQLLTNPDLDYLFSIPCKISILLKTGWIQEAEILLENWNSFDGLDEELLQTILQQTSKAIVEEKNVEKWIRFSLIATRNVGDKETEFRYEEISNLLLKQMCFILLQNNRTKEAKIALDCVKFDELNSMDVYLQMKMTLMENREDEFLEMISQLADTALGLHFESKDSSALLLACSAAIDSGSHHVLKTCLKKLLSNTSRDPVIKLNAHRCLIRLMVNENPDNLDVSEILQTMNDCQLITQSVSKLRNQYNPTVLWYARMFWNIALVRKSNEAYHIMLGCCRLLSEGNPNDQALLMRRKTTILHTIAIALKLCRIQRDDDVIITAVQLCEQLKMENKTTSLRHFDQLSNRILFLYEFEANTYTKEQEYLDQMWESSYSLFDYAICKILVGILMEQDHPSKWHSLLAKIVLETIRKGFRRNTDPTETWIFTRYLLQLIMNSSKSERWVYLALNQLVQCVFRFHLMYTESQLDFLASTIWNMGVVRLLKRDEDLSEKYFSLSLKLARQTALSKSTDAVVKFDDLQEHFLSYKRDRVSLF